jgi:hypothetical protein
MLRILPVVFDRLQRSAHVVVDLFPVRPMSVVWNSAARTAVRFGRDVWL